MNPYPTARHEIPYPMGVGVISIPQDRLRSVQDCSHLKNSDGGQLHARPARNQRCLMERLLVRDLAKGAHEEGLHVLVTL